MSKSINYSSEKLMGEFSGRTHIRGSLEAIKKRYQLADKKIIELGCGLGDNLRIFMPENDVIGFEGLDDATSMANERGLRVVQADLDSAPIPLDDCSVDVVLCMDVLEHLVNPAFCVAESRRVLRKNGLLIINVPNHFTFSGRVRILLGSGADSQAYFPNSEDWENPHIRFFRHASSISLLKKAGFEIVEDCSGNIPAVPGLGRFPGMMNRSLPRYLARKFPDLFASGFFMVAGKIDYE